ncbi:trans-aconitate 2-methyltransferase [Streptomyces sp. JJ38]|uniref:class I SAM-dependent methyltransferase n=1 Tax=Streptomyces sp. JJ38 TaxID=2738128 RepID=UPI001C590419|nr:class I SAM-dependent methyltransferase [Streptomyces sp. JJ38]MBW1599088.1 class I SAM-dependent methyltransferase [Streptomyces sp. JJ38]
MTGHQHTKTGHHHDHDHADLDWDAMVTELLREGELHLPYLERAAEWLRGLTAADADAAAGAGGDADGAPEPAVRRVLDVGSGPGVAACVLARAFPEAETVAADQSSALLDHAAERASGQGLKLTTHRADLPAEFGTLPSADLVWSSNVVHHLGDQQAALTSLAAALRPGGLLAIAERGLPLRFLPRDIGLGRPGLQARLDAAEEEAFAAMRAGLSGTVDVVEDWPALLTAAGLTPTGSRTFLSEHPAPLARPARAHLRDRLARKRERLAELLDAEDLATLDRLLDPGAESGLLHRPDAFYLHATTVHTARALPRG